MKRVSGQTSIPCAMEFANIPSFPNDYSRNLPEGAPVAPASRTEPLIIYTPSWIFIQYSFTRPPNCTPWIISVVNKKLPMMSCSKCSNSLNDLEACEGEQMVLSACSKTLIKSISPLLDQSRIGLQYCSYHANISASRSSIRSRTV